MQIIIFHFGQVFIPLGLLLKDLLNFKEDTYKILEVYYIRFRFKKWVVLWKIITAIS
jgi:hypothetical protein